ncbi:hypothetical protein ASC80_12890 [Afipia sp. Root123D2]|uniref:hypothetical protein n=1 Tax=Afipia sp. Root123D2 TaxID=1736436 RepID=UPI0006FC4042|nr:hypothetical protein [Afipia sp. Root123D2]KQW21037.1 hypothetical protein ASC80_12890 [Afipia sp. Root123D2]
MTDASADRPNDSDKHIEPNFSGVKDGAQGATASEASESAAAAPSREPSKEIVLQRLTPHSSWDDAALGGAKSSSGSSETSSSSRRYLSMAAVVALAAIVGAVGGSAATFGIANYLSDDDGASLALANQYRATQSAIVKLNGEVAALKSGTATHAAKVDDRIGKMDKLEDRIAKVEKAQAEPAAKLARLSEAVEKLRASEATGSVAKPTTAAAPTVSRLPTVSGWTLLGVGNGSATVEGRQGVFEVFSGDPLPGVGRVDAIRRQDGQWVVVTSRGLIVAR